MMKLSDKVNKGLEACVAGECRSKRHECPYRNEGECTMALSEDALALINQLEAKLVECEKPLTLDKAKELEKVKAERDAVIDDLKDAIEHGEGINYCSYCKHSEEDGQCHHPCNPYAEGETGWEWRGVKEEP